LIRQRASHPLDWLPGVCLDACLSPLRLSPPLLLSNYLENSNERTISQAAQNLPPKKRRKTPKTKQKSNCSLRQIKGRKTLDLTRRGNTKALAHAPIIRVLAAAIYLSSLVPSQLQHALSTPDLHLISLHSFQETTYSSFPATKHRQISDLIFSSFKVLAQDACRANTGPLRNPTREG